MRAATALRNAGLGTGEVVAVMLRNEPALLELMMAARWIGARWCPINWHFKAAEVRHILVDSEARLLVVHADLLAQIEGAIPESVRVFVVEPEPFTRRAYDLADAGPQPARPVENWGDFPRRRAWAGARAASAGQRDGLHLGHDRQAEGGPPRAAHARAVRTPGRAQLGLLGVPPGIRALTSAPLYHSGPPAFAVPAALFDAAPGDRAEVRRRADGSPRRIGAAHPPRSGADAARAAACPGDDVRQRDDMRSVSLVARAARRARPR